MTNNLSLTEATDIMQRVANLERSLKHRGYAVRVSRISSELVPETALGISLHITRKDSQ